MTERKNVLLDSIEHVTNTEQQNAGTTVALVGIRTQASRHREQVWMILNIYICFCISSGTRPLFLLLLHLHPFQVKNLKLEETTVSRRRRIPKTSQ